MPRARGGDRELRHRGSRPPQRYSHRLSSVRQGRAGETDPPRSGDDDDAQHALRGGIDRGFEDRYRRRFRDRKSALPRRGKEASAGVSQHPPQRAAVDRRRGKDTRRAHLERARLRDPHRGHGSRVSRNGTSGGSSSRSSRRKRSGSGLGLSITKKVIEDHGGAIGVTSSAGTGTVVTIVAPRAAADAS